ncbi:holin [Amycolatopsis sp. NPDC088138]|uniref:holin n=1 Tax=Amycolatopsis sp. NPDC088138 TaxID=3363938 RepID=UPI0038224EBA
MNYLKDLAERVGSTFIAGFLAALVANWTGVIPSDWKAWLLTGAVAGVASVVKGLVAKGVGNPDSASLTKR